MKVATNTINTDFFSLLRNPKLPVLLDANFFIPPNRTSISPNFRAISYSEYLSNWIEPLTLQFSSLLIHEAVRDEICKKDEKEALDNLIKKHSITLVSDNSLSKRERIFRNTIEQNIISTGLLEYIPGFHTNKDKGEVKTLAYAAAKGIHLFSSQDQKATHLIEQAERIGSGLDGIEMIYFYEFIFALSKDPGSKKHFLKKLYKDLYFFTKYEQAHNPPWGDFIPAMALLYSERA